MTPMTSAPAIADKFVDIGDFRLRYIEAGSGPALLLLHGASLGSSADTFAGNLAAFARAGFRAIAFDQPGHGRSTGEQAALADIVPAFLDVLGITRAALIGHSRAGASAIQLALKDASRYTGVVVLGTGSLLPPLGEFDAGSEAAAQRKQERKQATVEPTIEQTRKLLEADLYHHHLITQETLERRHAMSIGPNFRAFAARNLPTPNDGAAKPAKTPLYERLNELQAPLLMLYGREDRASAGQRAELLKRQKPELDLVIIEHCKHLLPWDAPDEFVGLSTAFLQERSKL
jgi:pimeloyl-ACP methyl ester carboxylesterase